MEPLVGYRMNFAGEHAERLLTEDGQWTEPWGDSEHGSRCDKCAGEGKTRHECWSCLLTVVRHDCPVCEGEVRWQATCPVCRGTGETDGAPRHGVSVFPTLEGLYHYMQAKGTKLDDCLIVALEAVKADDVDFDADQGALLVIPQAILRCGRTDPELAERVKARTAELGPS